MATPSPVKLTPFASFLLYYSPFESEATRSNAKATAWQGPPGLCADDAAILVLSASVWAGWKMQEKGKKRLKLEQLRVSSYPARDRVDIKHHLCSVSFYIAPPPPLLLPC